MKKKKNIVMVLLMCVTLILTGCKAKSEVGTSEPSKNPTLKELAKVFKEVDIKYYTSTLRKAFKALTTVQKEDIANLKTQISESYANLALPTKDSKYTKVTDMGRLSSYPNTTKDVNDSIVIVKNATLNSKEKVTIVALQGTDLADKQATGIMEDLLSGLELNNYYLYDAYRAIINNVEPGTKLVITGVSLGGMVAQQLASLDIIKEKYDVAYVVALGSPLITPEKIDYNETSVVRICDTNDVVPQLSQSATKGNLPKNVKIERKSQYKTFIGAHVLGYVNDEVWKNIDVLGIENGSSYFTFENAETTTLAAENYKAYKDKESK